MIQSPTTRSARATTLRRRALTAAALVAASAFTLTACAPSSSGDAFASGDTFDVVLLGAYSTPPDPDVNYDGPGLNIIQNTYEGLVSYEDGSTTATIIPRLATDWTVSDDSLTYTFDLRKGVTFHDGTEFTADAVIASFARRTDVDAGPAYMVADVTSVTAVDDYTVEVTLAAPNSAFLDYLASPFGVKMISPTVLTEQAGDDFAQAYLTEHDAGTGPYELGSVTTGQSYELTAYDDYWGDKPEFSTVDITLSENASSVQLQLERGEIDAVLGDINKTSFEDYSSNDELDASTFANFTTQTLFVNPQSTVFTTVEDRAKLFTAIDTKTILESSMGELEVPTTQLFPAGMLDASLDDQGVAYDPTALASLAESGIAAGKTIRIGYAGSSPDGKAVADELGADLSSAGLPAESISYGAGTIYGLADDLAAAPDLVVMSVFPDAGHVDAWARILYTPSGGLDLLAAEVPGLTDDLDAALLAGDDEPYGAIAQKVIASKYWFSTGSLQTTTVTRSGLTGIDDARNLLEYNVLHFAALGNA
jgi:peptide/nickel transport system substrate-binding protein